MDKQQMIKAANPSFTVIDVGRECGSMWKAGVLYTVRKNIIGAPKIQNNTFKKQKTFFVYFKGSVPLRRAWRELSD